MTTTIEEPFWHFKLIMSHRSWHVMRQLCQVSGPLLQYGLRVATNSDEKHGKSWNEPEVAVTLHRQSDKTSFFDLLTQQNIKV
jgi:hypothetical protein